MNKHLLLIFICLIALASNAQTSDLVFLIPAGEKYEGQDVLKEMERIDPDYFKAGMERVNKHTSQVRLDDII